MSENIARRVNRLVAGGFNALVNAVENAAPETVMAQAIVEIDESIDEVRAELGKVMANKHLASSRLMEENRKHEELTANIHLAVQEQRDELAEVAIAQQLDIEAQIPVLEAAIADAGQQEKELESYVRALLAKKREMEVELDNFKASRAANPSSTGDSIVDSGNGTDAKVDKASAAFDRVMKSSGGVPGPTGAADRKSAAQLAELEEIARANRIKERLAEVKAAK